MDLNNIEKVCSDTNHEEKYYAYNRVSAYDPNMCSTARFSPPYNSEHVASDQEADSYENVIQIPCTTAESETQGINRSAISSSEMSSTYATPLPGCSYVNEYISESRTYTGDQSNSSQTPMIMRQFEPQTPQIVLRQTPNGTIYQKVYATPNGTFYQNFYVTKVELIPTSEQAYRTDFAVEKESVHIIQAETGEMLGQLSESNFVQLDSELVTERSQEEFLSTSYNSIPTSNASLSLHDKDPQRLLLESTMSPLLAAVNDITQRDAELQSYLNQSLSRNGDINVFGRTEGQSEPQDGYISDKEEESAEGDYQAYTDGHPEPHDGYIRDKQEESLAGNYQGFRNQFQDKMDEEDCLLISDKPVESRARASLPSNYLYFGNSSDNTTDVSVYAKRKIPLRTKFGPFEGEIKLSSEVISDVLLIQATNIYPLLLVNNVNILDVSDDDSCNWMRFVRLAKNYSEQNLLLVEESGKLYFRSCQLINSKQELKVGYSEAYAKHYDLKVLSPTDDEIREIYNHGHPWPCYECDERFASSKDLQEHLSVHDIDEDMTKPKQSRRKRRRRTKHLVDIRKNSIRCLYCNKAFMTNSSLKQHIIGHLGRRKRLQNKQGEADNKHFRCSVCYKRFNTEDKLKTHRLIHVRNDMKPFQCTYCDRCCSTPSALSAHMTSHSLRCFSCVFCTVKFTNVSEFRKHITTHAVNGTYVCQFCKKNYPKYHLLRKHFRLFHQSFKFLCNECGRKFPNTTFLRRHKLTHSEQFEHLCSQCGKEFKRKDKLREHIQRMHSEKRRQRTNKKGTVRHFSEMSKQSPNNDCSPYREWAPKIIDDPEHIFGRHKPMEDYRNFMYKCEECMLGFKRRGMLVNHMVKRHPDVPIESIPELNLPILKPQSLFFCQYCSKVYKSNAKRKLHILKNHPGQQLPPSARTVSELSAINARTVDNLPTEPFRCNWCYKQYAARHRLVAHHRKVHPNLELITDGIQHPTQSRHLEDNIPTTPSPLDVTRPPCSPENKLLKLSSAALELSSIEDRKFFDFLNEKSQCSFQEPSSLPENHHHNLNLDDNGNAFSKVNFKVVESEFGESSTNGELNRLPQLFEESIACI